MSISRSVDNENLYQMMGCFIYIYKFSGKWMELELLNKVTQTQKHMLYLPLI